MNPSGLVALCVRIYMCTPDPNNVSHLVKSEEAEVPDDRQGTDPRPRGDLSCHLQTDLYYLQWVGEDHLGATSLEEETKRNENN